MASVRKRSWQAGGETKTAWIADYFDQAGRRHLKTFKAKKQADRWLVGARHEVATGVHTPERDSITVAEAGELWIRRGEAEGLERSTLDKYRNHVELHINPTIGGVKLARLTPPAVEQFRDDLLGRMSRPMAKKVLGSLKAILTDAQRRGLVAQNVASAVRIKTPGRDQRKLAVGVDIPTKAEVNSILAAATGRWRALLTVAVFAGLRSSELRGLTWADVKLDYELIFIRQRADQWGVIGSPKSKAGHRLITMAPAVAAALEEWKLACPKGELGLVFPNGQGKPESHSNIINRGFGPIQAKAGITGKKYGMHALRHFFASWVIEQGFGPKKVQAMLGHASIQMTFDTYGHLFPSPEDDHAKFAAGERALVGAGAGA